MFSGVIKLINLALISLQADKNSLLGEKTKKKCSVFSYETTAGAQIYLLFPATALQI